MDNPCNFTYLPCSTVMGWRTFSLGIANCMRWVAVGLLVFPLFLIWICLAPVSCHWFLLCLSFPTKLTVNSPWEGMKYSEGTSSYPFWQAKQIGAGWMLRCCPEGPGSLICLCSRSLHPSLARPTPIAVLLAGAIAVSHRRVLLA